MEGEAVNVVGLGVLGSAGAGLASALGAAPVFAVRRLSIRLEDGLLSFAAGVMLAASFFSLLLPGLEHGERVYGSRNLAVAVVIAGMLAGGALLTAVHRAVPHEHFVTGREGPDAGRLRRIWLFVFAITLHNVPEGMAVGVGFAGGDVGSGLALALGIGVQNIPEGLAVAVAVLTAGYGRAQAFLVAALSGLAEPVGGLVGALGVSFSAALMPIALGLAAGAMLFVISDEIIPETHRRGEEALATWALLGGFAAMMVLDTTFG